MTKPKCPHCNEQMIYIETLEEDRWITNEPTEYRLDIENWYCPKCEHGFKVESYYPWAAHHYGAIIQWG